MSNGEAVVIAVEIWNSRRSGRKKKKNKAFCSGHSVVKNNHFPWVKLSSLIYLPIRLVIVLAHTI